jgi:hypothetical protein
MAGDWIKVEMETPDKPEIGFIARTCRVTTAEAFEAWFRLWCWFDRQTENGEVQFFTSDDADRIARMPGIGNAISTDQGCGWVTFHARGATIVNWDRHNGNNAKKRALTNRRVSKWREAEKRNPHGPPPTRRNPPSVTTETRM